MNNKLCQTLLASLRHLFINFYLSYICTNNFCLTYRDRSFGKILYMRNVIYTCRGNKITRVLKTCLPKLHLRIYLSISRYAIASGRIKFNIYVLNFLYALFL